MNFVEIVATLLGYSVFAFLFLVFAGATYFLSWPVRYLVKKKWAEYKREKQIKLRVKEPEYIEEKARLETDLEYYKRLAESQDYELDKVKKEVK